MKTNRIIRLFDKPFSKLIQAQPGIRDFEDKIFFHEGFIFSTDAHIIIRYPISDADNYAELLNGHYATKAQMELMEKYADLRSVSFENTDNGLLVKMEWLSVLLKKTETIGHTSFLNYFNNEDETNKLKEYTGNGKIGYVGMNGNFIKTISTFLGSNLKFIFNESDEAKTSKFILVLPSDIPLSKIHCEPHAVIMPLFVSEV